MLKATSWPLISTGATSERYSGTIYEAVPTPSPKINRPSIKHQIVGAMPIKMEPSVKKISASIITFFLPILSEILPLNKAPIAAPIIVKDTTVAI